MSSTVLLVLHDDDIRAGAAEALARRGFEPRVGGSVVAAVEWMNAHRRDELAAIVLDSAGLKAEGAVWLAARCSDQRLASVPAVILARDTGEDIRTYAGRGEIVPYATGIPGLAAAVLRAIRTPAPPERVALGTERLIAAGVKLDLHTYTYSKLVQYLGEARAAITLQAITLELPGGRIVTTQDLHEVARKLRVMGELEANVATLLSGRATLLDSDRTLRGT